MRRHLGLLKYGENETLCQKEQVAGFKVNLQHVVTLKWSLSEACYCPQTDSWLLGGRPRLRPMRQVVMR